MKKMIIALVIIFVVIVVGILVIGRTFYPDNIAETALDGGKKDLKTRIYKTDLATAEKTVSETIPTLTTYGSSWKLAAGDSSFDDQKIVKAEVPVIIFTDDLQVMLKKGVEEGTIQVDVRSNSRVGKSDFGENRRHVVQILEALDQKLIK